MQLEYIGEALGLSKIGHILTISAFVSIVFSSLSYYLAYEKKDSIYQTIARVFWRVHSFLVVGLVLLLFYMLLEHKYEFLYIFKHSNDIMPLKYILSCFWAGQEGSFLLWIICHVVIGNVLQLTAKSWENNVMAIYALVQAFLVSMLLGIYIPEGWLGGFLLGTALVLGTILFYNKLPIGTSKYFLIGAVVLGVSATWFGLPEFFIGSNPFVLLTRDSEKLFNNEAFLNPNYNTLIQGQGLNPLLQNYWMTIHPPTLFMGFASTLVPFCFAIAGLWTKKLNDWMNPTLPWIYFGVMILGTGILMGGAWAYESLTFGGFWAWDPVENASLFPWLTFVGAAHVMIVQRKRGESSYTTFILTIFSFLFVVYSTYLTRSGVLSDTSVHSFASGSSAQILVFLFFFYWISGMLLLKNTVTKLIFTLIGVVLVFINNTTDAVFVANVIGAILLIALFIVDYVLFFDKGKKEEDHFSSREFWMLIGAIFLMLSCLQLVIYTSLPVINQIFGYSKVLNKTETFQDYSLPQMFIGIFIALIMGFSLFLKYKKTPKNPFWKYYSIVLIAGLLITILIIANNFNYSNLILGKILYPIFLWATLTTVIGNILHFTFITKGNIKKSGASIAHLGFGLILLGAFVSASQSEVISSNQNPEFNISEASGGELKNEENIRLIEGDTVQMGNYYVVYRSKYQEHVNVFYEVDYYENVNGKLEKSFTLSPFIQTNETFGRVSEPDTRHYLAKDLYTHITSASADTVSEKKEYQNFSQLELKPNGTAKYQKYTIQYDTIYSFKTVEKADSIELHINILEGNKLVGKLQLPFVIYKEKFFPIMAQSKALNLVAEISKVESEKNQFLLYMAQEKPKKKDYIILKAIVFPYINLLWGGCIIMIIGTIIAIFNRIQQSKKVLGS